ncbi:MAG: hypothetical protein P1U88_05975 [Thalassobaculaceae bacterium]|nr:hypothetical protein [Thalassobaculaceae bacterium]
MALTNTPAWPQRPRYEAAGVATANTATDGSGTVTPLITAGSDGTRVTGLYAGATASVSATAVRFFLSHNGGTNWTYLSHLDTLVPAHTMANDTVNSGRVTVVDQGNPSDAFDLPYGDILGFSIAVSVSGGQMIAEALGADY